MLEFKNLIASALAGEPGAMTLTGWQISFEASRAAAKEGRTLRVSFQEEETSCVWPITDHGTRTELTDFQRLLNAGPL